MINVEPPYIVPYERLDRAWEACTRCPLHKTRRQVVQYRGSIPCDVLFLGEGPGESEDMRGETFIGPAGQLLDDIIKEVKEALNLHFTSGFANIVACWPKELDQFDNYKTRPPNKEESLKCRPRLLEIIRMANAQIVVTLGDATRKLLPREEFGNKLRECNTLHPARILRQESTTSQNRDFKRCVTSLTKHLAFLKGNADAPKSIQSARQAASQVSRPASTKRAPLGRPRR